MTGRIKDIEEFLEEDILKSCQIRAILFCAGMPNASSKSEAWRIVEDRFINQNWALLKEESSIKFYWIIIDKFKIHSAYLMYLENECLKKLENESFYGLDSNSESPKIGIQQDLFG